MTTKMRKVMRMTMTGTKLKAQRTILRRTPAQAGMQTQGGGGMHPPVLRPHAGEQGRLQKELWACPLHSWLHQQWIPSMASALSAPYKVGRAATACPVCMMPDASKVAKEGVYHHSLHMGFDNNSL
jgi:hypothetical protein